ncbi:hypothetical protein [Actinophytocola xinjiangensis]|uniref:hypothetical protein n=1 Tax=Actinophytocola xinjiangensis TaxID=485602 RepID=UPI0012B8368E|nr:hypothetical protein [Actinophytocola xinjiangensis]
MNSFAALIWLRRVSWLRVAPAAEVRLSHSPGLPGTGGTSRTAWRASSNASAAPMARVSLWKVR